MLRIRSIGSGALLAAAALALTAGLVGCGNTEAEAPQAPASSAAQPQDNTGQGQAPPQRVGTGADN